ncbi:MAG: biotin/lipoyl-binding protein [Alphaproteobacteria bacterium]|nr:biotin/lipoyl-binding protein [Alphaproteobacteria bacterium]MBT5390349.1 biotin/lipoyl-binding protein [Alphaproteobacteria bacterium]MBT5539976.1 biotin/lipoyl-binding protein [Alphaproteobacteria bacterium]MBT5654609.1 biotin/lipoyl-binding protein [Alphaproteobacteria bacterium]
MRQKFVHFILPVVGVIGVSFMLFSLLHQPGTLDPIVYKDPAISPFSSQVSGIGIVEPKSELIEIGTHISGIATKVYVQAGQHVDKGDPLFMVDNREALAQLELSEAQAISAKVSSEDLQHQLSLLENVSDQRAISEDELSRKRYAFELGKSRFKEALERVKIAKVQLERHTVRALSRGEILQVNIIEGEYAPIGVNVKPFLIMGDTTVFYVRTEIDESEVGRVDPKSSAYAYLRGESKDKISLDFVKIEPLVTPKSQLINSPTERVDTRVLEVVYSFSSEHVKVYVGQEMDVYIEATDVSNEAN